MTGANIFLYVQCLCQYIGHAKTTFALCDLYPTQGSGRWLEPSPPHGIKQRCAVPREILHFWGSNLERLQSGVVKYPTFVFVLTSPFSCLTLFTVVESVQQRWLQEDFEKCGFSLSQETRSHTGWFAISSAWEIKVSSLFKIISPKAISLPRLSCCFCLYLFCLAGYCYCGLSLFPTHWGGSLDQKTGHRPLRGTRVPVSQVSTRTEKMQTHRSLFPVPWIHQSSLLEEDECKCSELSLGPWIFHGLLDILGSCGHLLLAFSGPGGATTASPGHWSTVQLREFLHHRRQPSPNSFKPVA